ncbi:MAG: N-acetylglucosamine-6-phosphate deacetylase [Deltaproteobacteria bacterium]|uniref:N-acetylglucosamine-6-phosphate deacetylase n=1 Tax=Candidatus Zymogenus saltonus TaxID=2844893 RepID=A0A9D8KJE6_9DELT|nr:N-acetylglucosamine-6-phosphate deacetylase [Candidatus Zymogenus saltonus]
MKDVLIKGGRLIRENEILDDMDVLLSGGKIASVDRALHDKAEGAEIVDAGGLYISPGFLDIHIHGAMGEMCEIATLEGMKKISLTLAKYGTTAFLPTLGASPHEDTVRLLKIIAGAKDKVEGAEIVGINMEGPYLNPKWAGAQRADAIRNYSKEELKEYIKVTDGLLTVMGLAPEVEGGMELVSDLKEAGIIPCAVHTDATYDQTTEAMKHGLKLTGHTFNAMRPIHHREPGIIVAAMLTDDLFSEYIADGFHTYTPIIEMAYRLKGEKRLVFVSDSVGGMGIPDGYYEFFGTQCKVSNGRITIGDSDILAGSASPLLFGVKNLHKTSEIIPLPHIIRMATLTPAEVIGVEDRLGSIDVGKDASVILLNDKLDVVRVWVSGKEIRY